MARLPAKVLRSHRFASRRRDVRRARQRRRRRVTITVVTLAILAVGGWMLARSSLFALERIEVAGNKALSRTEVVEASGLRPGANMLSLDMEAVEARIARLPLIKTVDVSKPAPSRVRIVVSERTPAFVLETIEGLWHLDAEGFALGPTPGLDAGLPRIRLLSGVVADPGDRVESVEVINALAIWRALPDFLRAGSPVITSTAGGFDLIRSDLTVRFGTIEGIEAKLEALRLVVGRAHAAKERLRAIDVRSPSRPAALAA